MSDDKPSATAFFAWIFGELSLVGRFAAFFGTILLLSAVASPEPTRLLAGLALVFLCLADRYWSDRYPAVSYTGDEAEPWYRQFIWPRVALAIAFLGAFVITGRFWLRLEPVRQFLRQAGIGFLAGSASPAQPSELATAWSGDWRQWSRGGGGAIYAGPLRLDVVGADGISGTFVNQREGASYKGQLEGRLFDGGRRAEGLWRTEVGEHGRFVFMLGAEGRSFAGTYSMNDAPADSNPSNTWTGQKDGR